MINLCLYFLNPDLFQTKFLLILGSKRFEIQYFKYLSLESK